MVSMSSTRKGVRRILVGKLVLQHKMGGRSERNHSREGKYGLPDFERALRHVER